MFKEFSQRYKCPNFINLFKWEDVKWDTYKTKLQADGIEFPSILKYFSKNRDIYFKVFFVIFLFLYMFMNSIFVINDTSIIGLCLYPFVSYFFTTLITLIFGKICGVNVPYIKYKKIANHLKTSELLKKQEMENSKYSNDSILSDLREIENVSKNVIEKVQEVLAVLSESEEYVKKHESVSVNFQTYRRTYMKEVLSIISDNSKQKSISETSFKVNNEKIIEILDSLITAINTKLETTNNIENMKIDAGIKTISTLLKGEKTGEGLQI